jgi:hypothetical protein
MAGHDHSHHADHSHVDHSHVDHSHAHTAEHEADLPESEFVKKHPHFLSQQSRRAFEPPELQARQG